MTTTSVSNTRAAKDARTFPASFAQQRLWFLDQLQGESNTAYTLIHTVRIGVPVNEEALGRSLNALVARHEVLRTTFLVRDEQPLQVVAPALTLTLPVVDLCALPPQEREAEALRLANAQALRPFDLARGPLLRATLFRLGESDSLLLLLFHHIIFDGWSKGVFFRELLTCYQAFSSGLEPTLAPLPIQYADFAARQRDWLAGEPLAEQLAYWQQHLAGAPAVLELPTDHPRPAILSSRGASRLFSLPSQLGQALKALSLQEGVSLYMTLVAAFGALLSRYSGQEDLLLGTLTADRSQPGTEQLLGSFVNTLVLRADLSGDPSFRQLLGRAREEVLSAQAHQDVPFEYLVRELHPDRAQGQNPFFQVMLSLEPPSPPLLPAWSVTAEDLKTGAARFDLSLELEDRPGGLMGKLEYSSDLFEEATIARMAGHWQTLLEGVVADPALRLSELPLLTESERHQLLVEWNATASAFPADRCVHQLFEEQARRTPEAVALVYEEQELTYRQLNERANQLAHHLQHLGVGPEVLVGLCMDRSIELVIGLLGILKAGGAYVPLDPAFPAERISFMLEDAQAPVLVTQLTLTGQLANHGTSIVYLDADEAVLTQQSERNVVTTASPDNLAYVIYTSGSTGRPKGVQIPHRAVVNFLLSMRRQPGLASDDTWLAVTTLSFDIAALELFLPLVVGARVVIASSAVTTSGTALAEALSSSKTTVMQATPVTWHLLLGAGWQGEPTLKVLCGGEALPPELARQLLPRAASLWNLYGPTETTIWSTACRVEPGDDEVTIGRPIANTHIYILDARLNPTPVGVPGELYIGGDGLARGYLNRPELTAERFIPHPFSSEPGARLYKTGDLARYRPDGTIEHLGRLDFQVKIRGFRIELGEIESVLGQHPAVGQAVVMARQDTPGDKRLVAYVVNRRPATTPELQQHVMQHLPMYMVPSAFVFMEALPLTPNNKVDRRRLPAPEQKSGSPQGTFVAPRTPLEETIAGIWAQVLGLEQVGIHDNFFVLGGHSLLAMQVLSRLRAALQVEVPLHRFLEGPTVAQLAQLFAQRPAGSSKPPMSALRPRQREAYRASSSQTSGVFHMPGKEEK